VTSTYSTACPNTSLAFTRGRLDIAASLTDASWDNGAGRTGGAGGAGGTNGVDGNAGNPGPPQRSDQLKPRSLVPQTASVPECRFSACRPDETPLPVARLRACLPKAGRPDDLPFDETHPDDAGATVDVLIARKRHLARQRPRSLTGVALRHYRGSGRTSATTSPISMAAPGSGQALLECAAHHSRNWSSRVLAERACLGRRL